jgi:hypothetical protein
MLRKIERKRRLGAVASTSTITRMVYLFALTGLIGLASERRTGLPETDIVPQNLAEAFLTLENIDFIKSHFPQTGVLSIDVDGNDYWFLGKLIDANPTVICVEYNASMGLESITAPLRSIL